MISARVRINIDKNASQAILQKIDLALDDLADFIFARSQELVHVDEGTLKKSGHVEREFLDKKIVYDAPYAAAVEYGSVPHMPPVEPIISWCERVLGLKGKEVERAGWAIAMRIKQRGGIEAPYLRPALDLGIVKAKEIIERRMG